VFAAASTAGAAHTTGDAALLVAGVALGSFTSVGAPATAVALLRRAFGTRLLRVVEAVAGIGMLGFGGVLAARTSHDG
jgi:hypothetical protein